MVLHAHSGNAGDQRIDGAGVPILLRADCVFQWTVAFDHHAGDRDLLADHQRDRHGLLLGRDDTYALTPTFTWIKGKQRSKFGAELHKNELNYFQNNSPGGTVSFDNAFTSVNSLRPGATGSDLASIELGVPTRASYNRWCKLRSLLRYATLPGIFRYRYISGDQ